MATPTKSQAASTPKNHPSTTPNRHMASPRLGNNTGTSQRPFAHKSPAVKTPASIHSHAHHLSAPSQPSSTPLAATTLQDDLLGLSSPAVALIGSIPPTGLTPLPSGRDSLGLSTHLHTASVQDATIARNPELEKLQRLQQVTNNLQSRRTGKGVSRENVERIAKLHGFTPFWDENNLTIAGTRVDLEVFFDNHEPDEVQDVVFKLNTADGDELRSQKEASEVLKGDLNVVGSSGSSDPWKSLENFSENLKLLSQLDHSNPLNDRFQAIENLYETFKTIWEEEKKTMKWRDNAHHLRYGNVGEPWMHRRPHLGLTVDYWADKVEIGTTKSDTELDSNKIKYSTSRNHLWKARFSCGHGGPLITSQKWLSPDVMTKDMSSDHPLDSDTNAFKPNWDNANSTDAVTDGGIKTESDAMELDKPTQPEAALDVGFVCNLDPVVLVPINVAASLNLDIHMVETDQTQAITYQQALQDLRNSRKASALQKAVEPRWQRWIPVFSLSGTYTPHYHSYALYPATIGTEAWCLPIKELKFGHPRQFAAVLPVLRQYAMLWTLLISLIDDSGLGSSVQDSAIANGSNSRIGKKTIVTRRNNVQSSQLSSIENALEHGAPLTKNSDVLVDISLEIMADTSKPRLDVLMPIQDNLTATKDMAFVQFSIVIEVGGDINVSTIRGIPDLNLDAVKLKLSRILTISEDLGVAVEWLLSHIRR